MADQPQDMVRIGRTLYVSGDSPKVECAYCSRPMSADDPELLSLELTIGLATTKPPDLNFWAHRRCLWATLPEEAQERWTRRLAGD